MRRKVISAGFFLLAVLAGLTAAIAQTAATNEQSPALAPTPASLSPLPQPIQELLRKGQQLEIERRWGDALAHYEDAIRQFPHEASLERRFELTRQHYDLGKRYGDRSFCACVQQLTPDQALDLYQDVLVKIQAHYVESPDFKNLVERGVNALDVALGEASFRQRNVPPGNALAVDAFRQEVRQTLGERVIASRNDARSAVAQAAQMANARLGLAATATILEFLCGATNALDPYSAYLTPNQLAEVYSQIEGNFVGIGVELKPQDGALNIVRVIPGSPAQQGGIRAGDQIIGVGDRSVRDIAADQAANMLQGEAGSTVDVTVVTPGQQPRALRILRQRIDVPSIDEAKIIDSERGIAYFKLVCFQKHTIRDLDAALWQLHRQGMRSLVIDLRGNPGGLLVAAVEAADRFLERGVIVSTRGRNPQEDFTYTARESGTWRVPLVVMIDHDSASAAEIFAGAIHDHRRGIVIGSRSYGKGSVQGIFPLSATGAGVRLTTARFYSPAGRPYARIGVEPDITIRQVAKPIDNQPGAERREDAALIAAVQQAAAQAVVPQ